jgi:hypothetical protein
MKIINNIRYEMHLNGGGDVWRIGGIVDGSYKWLSTPISYDAENDILKTVSGSVYHIDSYDTNKEDFKTQVDKDISLGNYEIH